jgi:hypothetical protein
LLTLLEGQGRYTDADQLLRQMQIAAPVATEWRIRIALGSGQFTRAIDELKLKVSKNKLML